MADKFGKTSNELQRENSARQIVALFAMRPADLEAAAKIISASDNPVALAWAVVIECDGLICLCQAELAAKSRGNADDFRWLNREIERCRWGQDFVKKTYLDQQNPARNG